MTSTQPNRRKWALGKGLGVVAFLFFLAKGLAWLAIAAAGYSVFAT